MKVKVTEQGVTVPKRMLPDVEEIEIRVENGVVLLIPAGVEDPLLGLGRNPVPCGLPDASEGHDQHLYGPAA